MLKLYNTLTQNKEQITKKNIIKIYTCGITVYDHCHIGHARIFLFFDTLIRYLNYSKIKIIFIRNITDIDDKIITKSSQKKMSIKRVSQHFTHKMHTDTKNLNLIEPSFEPKATKFIDCMISLIKNLTCNNYAYEGKNSDIYFNVKSHKTYGKLSKRKLDDTTQRQRHTQIINKNNTPDFTLWKSDKNMLISWHSPWGSGRPGWHTECAAMSMYYAKNYIDIHGGGQDLLFPHHENELSQCESLGKQNFIKIWMHVGYLKINKQKMSKSLNNQILIKNILKKYTEETLRFFFLLTHYKSKIDYSENNIAKSKTALDKLYKTLFLLNETSKLKTDIYKDFINALNDDLNIPKAISILFNTIKKIKQSKNKLSTDTQSLIYTIKYLGNIIGILKNNPQDFLEKKVTYNKEKIDFFLEKRNIARKEKNWKLADKIRQKLKTLGITIEDKKDGTSVSNTI